MPFVEEIKLRQMGYLSTVVSPWVEEAGSSTVWRLTKATLFKLLKSHVRIT